MESSRDIITINQNPKNRHTRRRIKGTVKSSAFYVIILIITVIMLFPILWILLTALKSGTGTLFDFPLVYFPPNPNFRAFIEMWQKMPLWKYLQNTIVITLGTTILNLVITAPASYAIVRGKFKIKSIILTLLLLSQVIPATTLLTPRYFFFFNIGLINTFWSVIIVNAASTLPFCTLMLSQYIKASVPFELEESAVIDGCSRFQIFYKINMPIAAPGVVAASIFSIIFAWNEFMWVSIALADPNLKTITLGIAAFINQQGIGFDTGILMALAFFATLPIIVVFLFTQKAMTMGISAGAMKE